MGGRQHYIKWSAVSELAGAGPGEEMENST